MSDGKTVVGAVYNMVRDLGWRVVDDSLQYDRGGRWSYHATVETDMGLARFSTRHGYEEINFNSLWYGGFDLTVSREPFIEEALA